MKHIEHFNLQNNPKDPYYESHLDIITRRPRMFINTYLKVNKKGSRGMKV